MLVTIGSLTSILLAVILAMSMRGVDISTFELLKTHAPKRYRKLKWNCRLNCPIVFVFCLVLIAFVPGAFADPTIGWIGAIWLLFISVGYLFLTVSWFLWAIRA
jgi:hypothetical protein